jgi:hypothetical protein
MSGNGGNDEYNVNDVGFVVGTVGREVAMFDLTDDEVEEELQERRAREARRIPVGFRAPARPRRGKAWPKVPRFDVTPRR